MRNVAATPRTKDNGFIVDSCRLVLSKVERVLVLLFSWIVIGERISSYKILNC